jgi:hypothetical protein
MAWRCVEKSLATANFVEFPFFPRTRVNKGKKGRRMVFRYS